MELEDRVKAVFKDVLDIEPEEIKSDESLDQSLGMDSTEMVEVTVAIKKEFGIEEMTNADIKKTFTFNQVVEFLKSKGIT